MCTLGLHHYSFIQSIGKTFEGGMYLYEKVDSQLRNICVHLERPRITNVILFTDKYKTHRKCQKLKFR
jgi:hypothetical protein